MPTTAASVKSCCPGSGGGARPLLPVEITRVVRCLRAAAREISGTRWVAPRLVGTEMVRCADCHGVVDGGLQRQELQFLAICVDPSGSLAAHAEKLKTC